jgi:hypothetical protein
MRKKKAALKKDKDQPGKDSKKDAIEAALARVRDKQQNSVTERKNIDNLTDEQQKKIEAIEARRKNTQADNAPENKNSAS